MDGTSRNGRPPTALDTGLSRGRNRDKRCVRKDQLDVISFQPFGLLFDFGQRRGHKLPQPRHCLARIDTDRIGLNDADIEKSLSQFDNIRKMRQDFVEKKRGGRADNFDPDVSGANRTNPFGRACRVPEAVTRDVHGNRRRRHWNRGRTCLRLWRKSSPSERLGERSSEP